MALRKRREPPLDPYERAARRSDPDLATLEPVRDLPLPQLQGKNLLLIFLVVLAALALVRGGIGSGPEVERSCDQVAYKLRATELKTADAVTWSATGPSTARVVFGLDTTALPATREDGLLAGPIELVGCEASGQFGFNAPAGEHRVVVYAVTEDGPPREVGTTEVTVSEP